MLSCRRSPALPSTLSDCLLLTVTQRNGRSSHLDRDIAIINRERACLLLLRDTYLSHNFCWISNFIGSARILAKNRDDFQKAGYSHHTYFCTSPSKKKHVWLAKLVCTCICTCMCVCACAVEHKVNIL